MDVVQSPSANESLDQDEAFLDHLIAKHAFACLVTKSDIHALSAPYYKYLTSEEAIEKLFETAGINFAPGLLEVIQCDEPPTIEYFKSLPVLPDDIEAQAWGIYVIVLEKEESLPLAYIGSGTNSDYGIRVRLNEYDKGSSYSNLPQHVSGALKDGYTIVHKGLLVEAPVPTAGLMPTIRTLLVTLEGTFQVTFWTMHTPRGKDWGMGGLCR